MSELVEYRLPFLAVIRIQNPSASDDLWKGVERLMRVALVAGQAEMVGMIRECLDVADCDNAPTEFDSIIRVLKSELERLGAK